MVIRIDDEMIITGDMRNPKLCLRAVFPSCSGLGASPISLRRSNFSMFRGDDLQITFTVVDESSLPVMINKSMRVQFWVGRTNQGPALITKERQFGEILFSGGIILLGDDFRFRLQLDSIDTENLEPGNYYWEVRMRTNNLKFVTMGYGTMTIVRDLIRIENDPTE